jgi:hypothetical protein
LICQRSAEQNDPKRDSKMSRELHFRAQSTREDTTTVDVLREVDEVRITSRANIGVPLLPLSA